MADDFFEFPEYPDEAPPNEKPRAFVAAGKVDDLPRGRLKSIRLAGSRVVVHRTHDGIQAFKDNCPHMGADLSMGRIVDGTIVCAWHGWCFALDTGECVNNRKWARVEVYRVRVVGDAYEVEVPVDEPRRT